jgi:hypothetical protein
MEWASPFARTRPPISTRLVVSNPSNRLVVVQKVQQFQCPFSPYLLRLQVWRAPFGQPFRMRCYAFRCLRYQRSYCCYCSIGVGWLRIKVC